MYEKTRNMDSWGIALCYQGPNQKYQNIFEAGSEIWSANALE